MKSHFVIKAMRAATALCLLVYLFACSKFNQEEACHPYKVTSPSLQNHVTLNDIERILERDHRRTKSSSDSHAEIIPYIGDELDTLMYIVNFDNNKGWKVFSSDKRTPAIIAEGDQGHFSLEEGNPAIKLWMSFTSENIKRVVKSSNSSLSFSPDEIRSNQSFWAGSAAPMSNIDPPIITLPTGHWEEEITMSQEYYDSIEHLVPKWHQYQPYNECCPYRANHPSERTVAGCVAVAGAQVLYYLHNRLGVPTHMFSEGSCIGVTGNYTQHFSNLSTEVWEEMTDSCLVGSHSTRPEAIMIGYVGKLVGMHYVDNIFDFYSWAIPENLKDDLFEPLGIHCTHADYNEDSVKTSLGNQMPIIVSASNLSVPIDFDIHCFVIDGYRQKRWKISHFHHYVLDEPTTIPYPIEDPYTTYTYSAPFISDIKINWGWSSQWGANRVNDGWYSLTAGWTVENGGTYDYNHNIKIIHDFTIINN